MWVDGGRDLEKAVERGDGVGEPERVMRTGARGRGGGGREISLGTGSSLGWSSCFLLVVMTHTPQVHAL